MGVNLENGDTYGDHQNWSDLRTLSNNNNNNNNDTTGLITTMYDDIGFLSQLVQQYTTNSSSSEPNIIIIDSNRIYVTDSSNGGLMTYTLLLYVPELFAAGAAFIANLPCHTIAFPINNESTVTPIMIMNGNNKDRLMKWEGGIVKSEMIGGGTVRSALATRDFWIKANHASLSNVIRTNLPNRNWLDRIRSEFYPPIAVSVSSTTINTASSVSSSSSKKAAAPVQFFTMDGGGHSMPSRRGFLNVVINIYDILIGGPSCHDVNGADIAWEFLSSYCQQVNR